MGAGHEVHTVTHFRLEQDHGGLAAALAGLGQLESLLDGFEVVTLGGNHVPAPGGPLFGQVSFSGDFGPANLLFLNRIPAELKGYTFYYSPGSNLPPNELDLEDVEWF